MIDVLRDAYARAHRRLEGWFRRLPTSSSARRFAGAVGRAIRPRPTNAIAALLAALSRDAANNVCFVQIGSNDGVQYDPLRERILTGGWHGIMTEPVPYVFERLRRNYDHLPGIVLENAAIADRDGELPFYYLTQSSDAGLPGWYDGIGSFRKDVLLSHRNVIPDIEQRLTCLTVPCLTFESLCRKHRLARIDVVQIDTEGYDADILRSMDLDTRHPAMLIYEHYHLTTDVQNDCRERLHRAGYETLEYGMDTLCVDTRPAAAGPRLRRRWRRLHSEGMKP